MTVKVGSIVRVLEDGETNMWGIAGKTGTVTMICLTGSICVRIGAMEWRLDPGQFDVIG